MIDVRNLFNATWSTNHKITTLGSINGVEINNVKVIDGAINPMIVVEGCKESRSGFEPTNHIVSNVSITDLSLYGNVVTSSYSRIRTNGYVNNLTFSSSGNPITGAVYSQVDVSQYGDNINFLH